MKFYGEPNSLVKERRKKPYTGEVKYIPLFRFDNNGEYETHDPILIEKLKNKFNSLKCNKCEAMFKSKGLLLAHYREIHPKE